MVNLEKQQNKRKRISLIKPQNIQTSAQSNNIVSVKCKPLTYDSEPRTAHPVYTKEQYEALNRQRVIYKDPKKFDIFPEPAPKNLNYPAVPGSEQSEQKNQHTAKKLHVDINSIFQTAHIHNNPVNDSSSQVNYNSNDQNRSTLKTLLIILAVVSTIYIIYLLFIYAPVIPLVAIVFLFEFFINRHS